MLPSGDTAKLQRQRKTQSERVDNDSLVKQYPKKSRCSHTYIWQKRLQDNKGRKRQRRTFYNVKGDAASRRHNSS